MLDLPALPPCHTFQHPDRLYTADQMHQYARDYAAALSQTAGVPEGWKLVPVEPTLEMENAWDQHYGNTFRGRYRAMLAAAPAASGWEYPGCSGDPASCPENEGHGCCKPNPARHVAIVCDWKDADPFPTFIEADIGGKSVSLEWRDRPDGLKELIVPVTAAHQSPSAASVSERARALLAAEFDGIGMHGVANDVRMNKLAVIDKAIIRAIEQALTQQRGSSSPEWFDDVKRCLQDIAEEFGHTGRGNRRFVELLDRMRFTTHQPSADAVRELVRRWRSNGHPYVSDCADELESLLSAASGEKGVGNG